jgi:DNA-binding transcriptional MerR regulator
METLLTIGEFAERSGMTQKALRLYAQNGLLAPTRIDGESGYRYYRARAALERHDARLQDRRAALREARRLLKEAAMFEVEMHEVPAQRYVSRMQNVKIDELERFIVETTRELGGGEGSFTIYHGQVDELSSGPVEVGVPRADGDKALPAQTVAATVVEGEQCDFPQILGAYDAIGRWAKENGRSFAGPPREVCLQEEPLRLQVAWPVK